MSRNVFVIDAADFMIDMIRMILEGAGHRVVGSETDSLKALARLKELASGDAAVDLVLVDLHMPKLDGFEAIQNIRTILPGAKVLLVSANSARSVALRARELKVDGFVVKPFEPDVLLAEVSKLD